MSHDTVAEEPAVLAVTVTVALATKYISPQAISVRTTHAVKDWLEEGTFSVKPVCSSTLVGKITIGLLV